MLPLSRILATLSVFVILAMSSLITLAQADSQESAVNPLRLSYINGSVSFWRYGAEDWVEARINIPLIPGDALYTGQNAELELQAEGRAFIRTDDNTQISLVNQTSDYLQLKVTSGRVSLDLRTLPSAGYTVELDTPNAVFTIDHTGYYRVDVDGDVHFITRRGGRATMTLADGKSMTILPSEEIVVRQDTDVARAETYVAPELDEWDLWNYDRTNNIIEAFSERYLPSGIAGARDLDYYGNWRVTDEYGPVWVPDAIASDWAPYSTGRWIWDPNYQWTWVDDAPWGWAPFHYGRWVYLGGYWAWAPGPVALNRPVYAPALVAFYGVRPHVSVSIGGPGLGWVALGWGEPLVPWWGRSGFIGRPWWGGWGGPRMVNNVIVRQATMVNITNISYANRHVSNALIATTAEQFGRGHMHKASNRLHVQEQEMVHIRGALPLKPNSMNLVADAPRGVRPPEQIISRPVVATRRPQEAKLPWRTETTGPKAAEQRYVPAPKPTVSELRRPDLGTQTGPERVRPSLPPRFEDWKRQAEPVSPSAVVREQGAVGRIESKPSLIAPSELATPSRERELAPPSSVQVPMSSERQQQVPRINEATRQPIRVAPSEITTPSRAGRELSSPTPAPVRIKPQERQPQLPRIEATPQPIRVAPTETATETVTPSRGGRELRTPTPAPVRITPQERQLQLPRIETAPQPTRVAPSATVILPRGVRDFNPPSQAPVVRIAPQVHQAPSIQAPQHAAQPQGAGKTLPGIPANRTYRGGNQTKSEREPPQR